MVRKITLNVPKFSQDQSHSKFHWTLTLLDRPDIHTRIQYFFTSTYVEMANVVVNGYLYEKLIFDFQNGKIHMYTSKINKDVILAIIQSITINPSPTSFAFCLLPRKKPNQNNN